MEEQQIWSIFICFWLAVFGAVLGSFLDCAVSRKAAGEKEIFAGRSRCGSCGHTLGVWDLVPVFSFLFRRGKCGYCKAPIPRDCLWSELFGALALGCVGLHFGLTPALGQWVIWAALLFALSLTDAHLRIIPDKFLVALAANRVVWFFVLGQGLSQLPEVGKACVIPAVLLALVLLWEKRSGREVMGGGDIKLLFVLALYLNWGQMLLTLLAGCLFGLIWAAVTRRKKGAAMPFGPFLAAGAVFAVCYGEPILNWYFSLF